MNALRIVKKFKNLTPAEEREYAVLLNASAGAVGIIIEYLEGTVMAIDRELTDVKSLYSSSGNSHLEVAALLATRSANMKLLELLTQEVVVPPLDETNEGV
jgi:hypothetical protein